MSIECHWKVQRSKRRRAFVSLFGWNKAQARIDTTNTMHLGMVTRVHKHNWYDRNAQRQTHYSTTTHRMAVKVKRRTQWTVCCCFLISFLTCFFSCILLSLCALIGVVWLHPNNQNISNAFILAFPGRNHHKNGWRNGNDDKIHQLHPRSSVANIESNSVDDIKSLAAGYRLSQMSRVN